MHRSLPIALSVYCWAAWIAVPAHAQRPTIDEVHRALPMRTDLLTEGVAGDVDRDGFADAVPSSPALLGAPVYWQALLGPPLQLTNLELTRFRDL